MSKKSRCKAPLGIQEPSCQRSFEKLTTLNFPKDIQVTLKSVLVVNLQIIQMTNSSLVQLPVEAVSRFYLEPYNKGFL